jgi:hypothetical protein
MPETYNDLDFKAHNALSETEARTLLFGHRVAGRDFWTGEQQAASITPDGMATLSGAWPSRGIQAKPSIEFATGDMCLRYETVRFCGTLFRNPGGTRAKQNEFFWDYAPDRAITFSQVE